MESQDNHHLPPEQAFQETGREHLEENTLAAPTPAAILKRLRLGRPSLLLEMDEAQLLAALESIEWQVRVAAVQKLEERGKRTPIEHLTRALKDEHEAVRAAAAQALGALGNPKAIPSLVDALRDVTWLVRAAAVQALSKLGEEAPVEPLMLALQDEDESVRAVAVQALGTMEERVPIERLLPALRDTAWQVREMAVLTLGTRGGHIPRATLMAALQDEDESVRRAVHFLLEMYPDRFAETAAGLPASVSEESTGTILDTQVGTFQQAASRADQQDGNREVWSNDLLPLDDEGGLQHATQPRSIQHYPRRGALHVLRLALLVCWSIFLGYLVSIAWNLVSLTNADLAQMKARDIVQALSTPLTALAGLNIPGWMRSVCILLVLLLFFGCLWAARDSWKEYKWMHSQGVRGEELEAGSGDHEQFTRAPVNSHLQTSGTPLLSRRAVLVGLSTMLIVGNSIAWSLLLNRKRRQSSSGLALGTALYIYRRHKDSVQSVAWSPNGTRIASGGKDKTVQVWDAANGGHSFTFSGHASTVLSVAWSPDGRRIASGNYDGTTQVWDVSTGRNVFTHENAGTSYGAPSDYALTAVAWSPDGSHIASANFGNFNGSVEVWNAINGDQSFSDFYPLGGVLTVAWSLDGKRIFSANIDGTVQVWDASTGRNILTYGRHSEYTFTAAAWSPDGKYIAVGIDDKTVQVWDASSGGHVYIYRGHYNAWLGFITAVAWSPDGKRIASGSADKTVHVWDAVNGEHGFIYRGHTDVVTTLAWSPDGKYIASGSDDKTVQVWGAG